MDDTELNKDEITDCKAICMSTEGAAMGKWSCTG